MNIALKIGILGTGAFSLAISHLLESNNIKFTILGRDIDQLNDLQKNKTNKKYSSHIFQDNINVLEMTLENMNIFDLIFYCLPSKYIDILDEIDSNIHIVVTSKGYIDKFIFERLNNYTILSGGSYSEEILKNIPCYITLASNNHEQLLLIEKILSGSKCLISKSYKPESIELLGIFKNIIAVFCGIITQLKMGKNIEAAFISKILQNLNQFIDFDKTTLVQPAGIGDLFLSCSSIKSRNYSFGINLILNRKIEFDKLVEGYNSLNNLKSSKNIKLISDLDHIIQEIVNHSNQETICNLIINLINTI
jgi:glycerol-3-phosphate dehydrogenase (NAD(P)+)